MIEVEFVAFDLAAQRFAGPENMVLSDVLVQAIGTHTFRERALGPGESPRGSQAEC